MQINKLDTVLCEALEHAGIDSTLIQWARAGAEWFSVSDALASGAQPIGPLLLECQGQRDYALAVNYAHGLRRRMAADGREISDTSIQDAIGDACLALAQWRASGPAVTMREEHGARGTKAKPVNEGARVAWRAVVASLAHDILGDSVPLYRMEEHNGEQVHDADWLFASALPMPGGETALERRQRWQIERARESRLDILNKRMEHLATNNKGKGAGKARRIEAIAKVQRAVVLMMHGEPIDKAAEAVGFHASGRSRAGDRLAQAVRRLGLPVGQFTVRDRLTIGKSKKPVSVDGNSDCPIEHPITPYLPPVQGELVEIIHQAAPVMDCDTGRNSEKRRNRRAWIAIRKREIALEQASKANAQRLAKLAEQRQQAAQRARVYRRRMASVN